MRSSWLEDVLASKSDRRWTRGVSYARFSTDQQHSTDEQHDNNAELAAENGIDIVAGFTDKAESRIRRGRPEFLKMLAFLAENVDVGWVVVAVSDRLTSGLQQHSDWEVFAEEHDIRLKTKQGDVVPFNGEHQVAAAKNAVAALDEVVKIRERTRTQLRSKVRSGEVVAMRPAFGVRYKPLVLADGSPIPHGTVAVDPKTGRRRRSGVIEPHPDDTPVAEADVRVGRPRGPQYGRGGAAAHPRGRQDQVRCRGVAIQLGRRHPA